MRTSYRERDHIFGRTMLTLRTQINLTQEELSNLLGVSRRSIGEWEAGGSYPKAEHLKKLITLAVKRHAFSEESMAQEIRALWKAAHQRVLLDESWLASLLEYSRSSHLHLVPKPVEAGMNSAPVGRQESRIRSAQGTGSAQGPGQGLVGAGFAPGLSVPTVDWGGALTVPTFYGREEELTLLFQWIVQDHCRVVSVLGMGGIGKSTLAVKFTRQLVEGTRTGVSGQGQAAAPTKDDLTSARGQGQATAPTGPYGPCPFEVIIFRSLRDAPSCEALIAECLQVFSPQAQSGVPAGQAKSAISMEKSLSLLLEHLQQVRALVVLDGLECLVEDRDVRGKFRPGFEEYGWLLHRVAETTHQSCLLLTSREKPADLRLLGCKYAQVRSLQLAGLDAAACQRLIKESGVVGSQQEQAKLIEVYSGNPLALKIVAKTIIELFGGEIGPFLAPEAPVIFGSITDLLDEQFARLAALEQTVMYWLAIMREPVTFDELLVLLAYPLPRVQILDAIDSLRQRSLIERGKRPGSFTLQSIMLEYVRATFIAQVSSEIQHHRLDRLIQHSLILSQDCEYMRQTQERLLLFPLLAHMQSIYPIRVEVEEQLLFLLDELRKWTECAQGYGPANLIALLRLLRGPLSGLDLSHLSIRGAYLPSSEVHPSVHICRTIKLKS